MLKASTLNIVREFFLLYHLEPDDFFPAREPQGYASKCLYCDDSRVFDVVVV